MCASVGEAVDDVEVEMVDVLVRADEDVVLDEDVEARVELVEVLLEVLVLDDEDVEVLVEVVEDLVLELELVVVVDDTAREETAAML